MPETLSKAWEQAENKVAKAEIFKRESAKASSELYARTGLTNKERETSKPQEDRRNKIAARQEKELDQEAEALLGETDSAERSLVTLQKKNLIAALREHKNLEKQRKKLIDEEAAILRETDAPQGSALEALKDIRSELKEVDRQLESLVKESPEAFFGIHLKKLEEYKRELERGKIVETPYVAEKAEDIVAHLQANKPVLVYGHFGSGKTELAMHVARQYLGKEALVISGAKNMALAELYGHQVLQLDKINQDELDGFTKMVEEKFKIWAKANKDATEEEKNRAHDRILQTYLTQIKSGTVSRFFLGPIYQAMKEGRPVIIDEVNAIPHEVLISLNHILTRKPGDSINVQQDSGETITVKDGFCIMMTGNLNQGQEQYVDRQDMDPAFLSRLHKTEYDYLPQKTEGSLENEACSQNELFHLVLAYAMDKNGNMEVPVGSINKLWRMTQAARITQDVFAGREVKQSFYLKEAGNRSIRYILKEAVLTLRALDAAIRQWKKDGYKYELDHYLWSEFVAQSTNAADRAYLYQLLKDQFGFFKSPGWEQNPSYGKGGAVRSFEINSPKNSAGPLEFMGPREVVRYAFGVAPERKDWPDTTQEEPSAEGPSPEILGRMQALEEISATAERLLKDIESEIQTKAPEEQQPDEADKTADKKGGFFSRLRKKK